MILDVKIPDSSSEFRASVHELVEPSPPVLGLGKIDGWVLHVKAEPDGFEKERLDDAMKSSTYESNLYGSDYGHTLQQETESYASESLSLWKIVEDSFKYFFRQFIPRLHSGPDPINLVVLNQSCSA